MGDKEADVMREWRVLVVRPQRLLVVLNVAAATVLFGICLYMLVYGSWWSAMGWWLELLKAAGLLSAVALAGSWLERR